MPKKPLKLRPDVAEVAFRVFQEAIGEKPKTLPPKERAKADRNQDAVKRGAKGGKKGGAKRAINLTPSERAEVARVAGQARWKKAEESPRPKDRSQN